MKTKTESDDMKTSTTAATQIVVPPGTKIADLERVAIEQALARLNGNRTRAAGELGISIRTLQRKISNGDVTAGPSMRGVARYSRYSASIAH